MPQSAHTYLSDVLANASELSGNSDKVLQFSDPDLEQSLTVDLFLELAVNAKLTIPAARSDHELAKKLLAFVGFLQKYDCEPLWRQLHLAGVELLSEGKLSPKVAFVVACAAGQIGLGAVALDKMCHLERDPSRYACPADPGTFSLELWALISQEHAWAYCVAFRGCGALANHCAEPRYTTSHHLGAEFQRVIGNLSRR